MGWFSTDPIKENDKGLHQLGMGNPEKAAKHFIKAISAAPNDPVLWWNLGFAQAQLGDREKATAALQRHIDLGGENSEEAAAAIREMNSPGFNWGAVGKVIGGAASILLGFDFFD